MRKIRWMDFIKDYNFEPKYDPGKVNMVVVTTRFSLEFI